MDSTPIDVSVVFADARCAVQTREGGTSEPGGQICTSELSGGEAEVKRR